jgi:holo-[acyl-carrier protein] synthase
MGVDIVEVSRFALALARRGERLAKRVFSPEERVTCGASPHRLAARFAAKEAFYKALGTGMRSFHWREVEVKNDRLGAPYLCFSSRLSTHLAAEGIRTAHLSLSHSGDYAIAQVILEGE